MPTEVLRDPRGNKIAEIEIRSDGIQILRLPNGVKVGEYYPRENTTRKPNGEKVGQGNLLTMLLK
jgi:hypothetical protein